MKMKKFELKVRFLNDEKIIAKGRKFRGLRMSYSVNCGIMLIPFKGYTIEIPFKLNTSCKNIGHEDKFILTNKRLILQNYKGIHYFDRW